MSTQVIEPEDENDDVPEYEGEQPDDSGPAEHAEPIQYADPDEFPEGVDE